MHFSFKVFPRNINLPGLRGYPVQNVHWAWFVAGVLRQSLMKECEDIPKGSRAQVISFGKICKV